MEEGLAIANFVFTAAFTIEMVLKLIGLGAWKYLSDAWSLFDAVVVAFSLVELVTELMARTSANGLTALRWGWLRVAAACELGCRALLLLKLCRRPEAIRWQL